MKKKVSDVLQAEAIKFMELERQYDNGILTEDEYEEKAVEDIAQLGQTLLVEVFG